MAKIITFSGKARSGKDCSATIIKKELKSKGLRVFELAFGDYVKAICSRNYGYDDSKKDEQRNILQEIGTDDVRETKDSDFWVKIVAMTADLFKNDYDVLVLTDARFNNEMNHDIFDKSYNFYRILVRRDTPSNLGKEELSHKSEQLAESNDDLFDCIIQNDGSLEDLENMSISCVDDFMEYFNKGEMND